VGSNLGVSFYDFESLELLDRLPTQAEVTSISWSPESSRIASGMQDGTLIIWDARTGEQLKTLRGDAMQVLDVAWSPDGRTLASASVETFLLCDADTGERLRVLEMRIASKILAWSQGPALPAYSQLDRPCGMPSAGRGCAPWRVRMV